MEGDDYSSSSTRTYYSCLSEGSYALTIYDSCRDRLCCSYGDESYSIKVDDTEVAFLGVNTLILKQHILLSVNHLARRKQPTPYPTETPPTPHPTYRPPTMFPTHKSPTMFPTKSTPACGSQGDACKVKKDCCSKTCRGKTQNRKCGYLISHFCFRL